MNSPLFKQLLNFGLSEKEIKIYLALLELETASVSAVARHSGVNRSSAYVVLERLMEKGLAGISGGKVIRHYIAASPETLLHSAKVSAKKQEEAKTGIESILPELKALHKGNRHRPTVKIFEGEEGLREVYLDLFTSKAKEIRTFANPLNIFKKVPDFSEWFDKKRGKEKIKMLVINPGTKEVLELYKINPPKPPVEALLIPEEKFKFSSDLGIYGDKITLISTIDDFAITIESKEFADILKNSFDLAWEEAKRLNKKIK